MFTKLAKGFDELADVGLIERTPDPLRRRPGGRLRPGRDGVGRGTDVIEPVRGPDTIVRSLAIGNPADGRYSVELARATGGSIEAIPDETTAAAIRQVATLEGIYSETAGGVTVAAAAAARRRGVIRDGDEVVALLTGNGLKTPDAIRFGLDGDAAPVAESGRPASPRSCRRASRLRSVAGARMSAVRIPPVLRTVDRRRRSTSRSPGATVREVIDGLVATYPGLAPQLLAGDGELNRFVNVFLNDTDVRHLDALDTAGRRARHRRAPAGDGRRRRR